MKTIVRPKRYWLLAAALFAAFGALLGACSNNDSGGSPTDGNTSAPIQVQEIIASPKSADPGDTLVMSAIVVSNPPNQTDIPTLSWTASGGAFLETDQTSVRWVAPATGVYTVTAKAQNTANSASNSADVFVGGATHVVSSQAGAVQLRSSPGDLYYLRTNNNINLGVEVFGVSAGISNDAVDLPASVDGANGKYTAYAPDVSFEVHSIDSIIPGEDTQPIHLYIGDFASKNYRRISLDIPANKRHPQYTDADVASDNRSVAFGGMCPTPTAQGADSFDVFVDDVVASTRQRVTRLHTNHRNAFPTWSTDQRWLTFVSDRSGRNQWDLYGMPITGGVINTAQASLVRLSNTGGVLMSGTIGSAEFKKPLMAWNPAAPTLAVVASDGSLYLIMTTPSGATQFNVGPGHPTDLAWSPDGSMLAFQMPVTVQDEGGNDVLASGVVTVQSDGSNPQTRVARAGDNLADIAWSPDGAWLVYRVTRASSAWLEVYDLDQSTITKPIAITASERATSSTLSLVAYRAVMSMKPVWSSAGVLYYPSFATGANTVGIVSVDVSGLTP